MIYLKRIGLVIWFPFVIIIVLPMYVFVVCPLANIASFIVLPFEYIITGKTEIAKMLQLSMFGSSKTIEITRP